jgi:hypothetical protein
MMLRGVASTYSLQAVALSAPNQNANPGDTISLSLVFSRIHDSYRLFMEPGVMPSCWQANSERGESPAAIPADRGRLRKGVDMLWNIGTIGRHGMQRTAFPNERTAKHVKSQELAKASPAFDAWLQAYRKHLAEACQCANYRPASPANANG